MNLSAIEQRARVWLDDLVEPYLFSSALLWSYGTEAQAEANLRARLLIDSQTAKVCNVAIAAGANTFTMHPSIIVIRRAEWQSSQAGQLPNTLKRQRFDVLDRQYPQWRSLSGEPTAIVQDLDERIVRLDRTPVVAGTLRLTVWRRPLESEALELGSDDPVINDEHHPFLAHWLCHRALLQGDAETRNPDAAARHLADFTNHFGERPSVAQLKQLATDEAGEVEGYWY